MARVLGPTGEDLGVMTVGEARAMADTSGLDFAVLDDEPGAELVVVRIGEYGLIIYEQEEGRRAVLREARRAVREVVDAERRQARRARPERQPWERKRADRDKR
jgi:translation initiation factor IF-3